MKPALKIGLGMGAVLRAERHAERSRDVDACDVLRIIPAYLATLDT